MKQPEFRILRCAIVGEQIMWPLNGPYWVGNVQGGFLHKKMLGA